MGWKHRFRNDIPVRTKSEPYLEWIREQWSILTTRKFSSLSHLPPRETKISVGLDLDQDYFDYGLNMYIIIDSKRNKSWIWTDTIRTVSYGSFRNHVTNLIWTGQMKICCRNDGTIRYVFLISCQDMLHLGLLVSSEFDSCIFMTRSEANDLNSCLSCLNDHFTTYVLDKYKLS